MYICVLILMYISVHIYKFIYLFMSVNKYTHVCLFTWQLCFPH